MATPEEQELSLVHLITCRAGPVKSDPRFWHRRCILGPLVDARWGSCCSYQVTGALGWLGLQHTHPLLLLLLLLLLFV